MNAPSNNEHVRLREGEKKVTVINDPKMVNGSIFYFAKEDHTLGNALRYCLLRDKDVRFAGYRMPHPLQFVCEMKVQTTSADVKPITVMISSLEALESEFYLLENQFRAALNASSNRHNAGERVDDVMALRGM
jgi:DNA-directed RNA polymerase II subunit RPB11